MPHSKLFVALFVAGTFGLLSTTACGEKSGTATGSVCPQGSTLTYDTFGKSFFTTYCISCHVAGGQQSDTPLTTVEQIRARRSKIDEYAAAGPKAVNTVMPEEGTSPPEAERRKLGEWLACGAP